MPQYKSANDAAREDGGTVKGYASTFDREPDSYGDVIAPGAFEDTIKRWAESGKSIPLLYGHNMDDPEYNIGRVTEIREDERGLYVEAEFDADNPKAQYVRKLVREGRLYQFSFAFDVLDYGTVTLDDGTKATELRKLELYEVSLVQIPANQHAEVTEVKAGRRTSKADEAELARIGKLVTDLAGDVAETVAEIQTIINGLTETPEEQPTPDDEANSEEPPAANEEERKASDVAKLIDEANQILKG